MKKTLILTLAALMTFSMSSLYASAADMTETSTLAQKQKPSKKKKGEVKEVTFLVHLHCANCVKKVQENIAFEKGVKDLKVTLEDAQKADEIFSILMGEEVEDQEAHGENRADGDAEDGAGCHVFHTLRQLHNVPCQRKADAHLAQRLQHLRDGGGQHIALALEEAPEGAHDADQQHTGTQGADGGPGIGLILKLSQLTAEKGHQQTAGNAENQENAAAGGVDPADLVVVTQGIGLGDHPAHGHGQARRGDQQQDGVDVVGGVEIAEALFADNGVQRDLIQCADDFDDDGRKRQYRRTREEILFLVQNMF